LRPPSSTSIKTTILALFLLSGATSLVYEVVWLRQLILIFGSTQFATSTILSTFMGGLALGAFLAGRLAPGSRFRPLAVYGVLEICIGVYAVAVPTLFRSLTPIYQWIWNAGASESFLVLSLVKFVGIAVVLLPPTVLMGASLPLLAREVADDPDRIGGKVGRLYAINTFGAVAGVFVAGFVALPQVGVRATLLVTALVNLLLGTTAIVYARRSGPFSPPVGAADRADDRAPTAWRVRLVLLVFALSGLGALVLEVAWTRLLALVIGSSVYAFALMLLAFLTGLGAGGAFFSRWLRRRAHADPYALLALLLGSAGLLAYATTFLFDLLPRLFGEIYFTWNPSSDALLVIELGFGLLVMFPATFALGGIFPTVLQIHARSLAQVAGSVGVVYASNTVGTIVGAALAGFVLIPGLGVQPTVLLVAGVEIALGLLIAAMLDPRRVRGRTALATALAGALLLPLLLRPTWDAKLMNSGVYMNLYGLEVDAWDAFEKWTHDNNVVVYAEEGLTSSVFVADQPDFGNRYLSVNGKIEASTNADLETQLMASHLPLLMHPDPRDVMVIGLASGITVGAAASHPVDTIRVVEVEKKMVPAARLFEDYNNHVLDDPRVRVSINDARNELEFSPRTYDAIISEPSNPWMTVAANLFTEDFFRLARTRVRPGGLFCQWIQNYYLPADDLRSIVRAFHESFPNVMLFETFDGVDILLLGSQEPLRLDLDQIEQRLEELSVRMDLARVNVRRAEDLLTLFRLGPRDVARLVEDAPRNTDDNARVEFSAPKTLGVYTLDDNLEMLRAYASDPLDYVVPEIRDRRTRDEMGLELAQSFLDRGYLDLASSTVARVGDSSLIERKDRLLQAIRTNEANP